MTHKISNSDTISWLAERSLEILFKEKSESTIFRQIPKKVIRDFQKEKSQ